MKQMNNIDNTESFVTLEQAKSLKTLGFNYPVSHWYCDAYDKEDYPYHCYELSCAGLPSFVQNYNDLIKFPITDGWDNNYSAPTQSMVQKWLRDEKKLIIEINCSGAFYQNMGYKILSNVSHISSISYSLQYNSYEDALSAGITKCIELLCETNEIKINRKSRIETEAEEFSSIIFTKDEYDRAQCKFSFANGARWSDEHPKSPWVKCDTELPLPYQSVIVKLKNKKDAIFATFYDEYVTICDSNGYEYEIKEKRFWNEKLEYISIQDVVAWMPIPKFEED